MFRVFILLLFNVFFYALQGRFYVENILDTKPVDSIQVSSGKLIVINEFKSKFIRSRTVLIWLPNEYLAQTNTRFPVIYMHDGQMLFDSNWTWNHQEWGMDELIAKSQYKSIVVGIFNDGKNRSGDYFPEKPWKSMSKESQDSIIRYRGGFENIFGEVGLNSDEYLKFLVSELKPFVDKNFRTKKDAKNTIIAGASMGGLISWYALCEYPKVFGNAICLSTHWPGSAPLTYEAAPVAFKTYLKEKLPTNGHHRLFFARGTGYLDSFYAPFQKNIHTVFLESNYNCLVCGDFEIEKSCIDNKCFTLTDHILPMNCYQYLATSTDSNFARFQLKNNKRTPSEKHYQFILYKGHDHRESAWKQQMQDAWDFIFQ